MLVRVYTPGTAGVAVVPWTSTRTTMSSSSKPSVLDRETELDVEWERFAQNGCPDWWLMTRYTSGWLSLLSRGLPYLTFKERSPPSGTCSQPLPEAELQQTAQQTCDEQLQVHSGPAQSLNTKPHPFPTTPSTTSTAPTASASVTHSAGPAAPPWQVSSPAQACPVSSAASHIPAQTASCTNFKGLFTCQSTAQSDKGLGQTADVKAV